MTHSFLSLMEPKRFLCLFYIQECEVQISYKGLENKFLIIKLGFFFSLQHSVLQGFPLLLHSPEASSFFLIRK